MAASSPPSPPAAAPGKLDKDHIEGTPHGHPHTGGGVSSATGAVAGFALGAMAGPVGALVGTAAGALIGANIGKDKADEQEHEDYWRKHHEGQPFARPGLEFEDYARAYRTGYTGYRPGQTFDDREGELRMDYEGDPQLTGRITAAHEIQDQNPPVRTLDWEDARHAVRAAYDRREGDEVP